MPLTAEQHALRLSGIGASEIGGVVGADGAWDSGLTIWGRKVGKLPPDNDTVSEHIELGNLLEPVIASLYARRTGFELIESGTLVHPKDPLRIATPDRLVKGRPRGAQIKKARSRAAWGEEGTDDIPENIICQVQWEMGVAELELEDVPVLFWGSRLVVFTVHRDEELIGMLTEQAHKWWRDYVVTGRPPTPDGSERCRETLQRLFPKVCGKVEYPMGADLERVLELARAYENARDEEKAAENRKSQIGNELRLLIGDKAGFQGMWGSVTWTPDAKGKPSWKAIAEALNPPVDLIAKNTSAPGRTLRVHLKGV